MSKFFAICVCPDRDVASAIRFCATPTEFRLARTLQEGEILVRAHGTTCSIVVVDAFEYRGRLPIQSQAIETIPSWRELTKARFIGYSVFEKICLQMVGEHLCHEAHSSVFRVCQAISDHLNQGETS